MGQINCYIPIKLCITGKLSDTQLEQLGEALTRTLRERIAFAERVIVSGKRDRLLTGAVELVQEEYDPFRESVATSEYAVPSYQDRGRMRVVRWKRQKIPPRLEAGILARGRVRVPTKNVWWLLKLNLEAGVTWVKRLKVDLSQVLPEVDVTIELFRVQDLSNLTFVFQRYLEERHNKHLQNFKFFAGRWAIITLKSDLESKLKLSLDQLFQVSKVPLPERMNAEDQKRHVLLVYASFPSSIEKYMVSEGVIEAEEAIEAALQQKPIGRLNEILKNPEQFRDKLEGPDDRLVVVLVEESGTEEKKVVSLRVLRQMIAKIEKIKQNPLLHGHFKRVPSSKEAPPEVVEKLARQHRRIQFYSSLREIFIGTDRVVVHRTQQWEVINRDNINGVIVEPRSEVHEFVPEEPVALRVGGPRFDQVPDPKDEIEIIIPAVELATVIQKVNKALNTQNLIRGSLIQLERLTDAITIYFAISTGGLLIGAGQTGVQTLSRQGLRAGLGVIGRALLTRQASVLGGEVALNLVLPSLTIWVDANRDNLKATAWGRGLITSVDTVNITLAVYGLGRLTLGAARILKVKLIGISQTGSVSGSIDDAVREVDDLIQKAEQATAEESRTLYATAVGDRGQAIRGLVDEQQQAVLAAAEWNPILARRSVLAETDQGFQRYTDELATELKASGMSDEQVRQFRAGIWELNKQRRSLLTAVTNPALVQQRVAELGAGAELRQEARTLLDELSRRRRDLLQAGNNKEAQAVSLRMRRLFDWVNQRNFLRFETEALQQTVEVSPFLSSVAGQGGGPSLRRLWLMFRAPRQRALKVSFEEYVHILQRHFRGNFGEFEVAFRLSDQYIILKSPDALVTLPGTDLIVIPRGGGDLLLIDNKALNAGQVDEVNALTKNLPKNINMDINEFAKLAGQSGVPTEFQQALTLLRDAQQEIEPIIRGLSRERIATPAIQQQINAILQKHNIRRVVTNAGGNVQGLSPELESIGLELLDLN